MGIIVLPDGTRIDTGVIEGETGVPDVATVTPVPTGDEVVFEVSPGGGGGGGTTRIIRAPPGTTQVIGTAPSGEIITRPQTQQEIGEQKIAELEPRLALARTQFFKEEKLRGPSVIPLAGIGQQQAPLPQRQIPLTTGFAKETQVSELTSEGFFLGTGEVTITPIGPFGAIETDKPGSIPIIERTREVKLSDELKSRLENFDVGLKRLEQKKLSIPILEITQRVAAGVGLETQFTLETELGREQALGEFGTGAAFGALFGVVRKVAVVAGKKVVKKVAGRVALGPVGAAASIAEGAVFGGLIVHELFKTGAEVESAARREGRVATPEQLGVALSPKTRALAGFALGAGLVELPKTIKTRVLEPLKVRRDKVKFDKLIETEFKALQSKELFVSKTTTREISAELKEVSVGKTGIRKEIIETVTFKEKPPGVDIIDNLLEPPKSRQLQFKQKELLVPREPIVPTASLRESIQIRETKFQRRLVEFGALRLEPIQRPVVSGFKRAPPFQTRIKEFTPEFEQLPIKLIEFKGKIKPTFKENIFRFIREEKGELLIFKRPLISQTKVFKQTDFFGRFKLNFPEFGPLKISEGTMITPPREFRIIIPIFVPTKLKGPEIKSINDVIGISSITQRPKLKVGTPSGQRIKSVSSIRQAIEPIQAQKITTRTDIDFGRRTRVTAVPQLKVPLRGFDTGFRFPREPRKPPREGGGGFGLPKFGGGDLGVFKQRKPTKRQFKFTPSLTALEFKVFGKQPGVLTGIGVRPIPV